LLLEDLSRVDSTHIAQLCAGKCPESATLDFKRDLPGNSDKDKHELLKDVSALANSEGGDLVYGIDEQDGAAASIKALTAEPLDAAKRRIAQVLDAGLEPRVQGVQIVHVDVPGGYVLVVRVPPSFDSPHCIRSNANRRFVMRNGTTTTDMTYDQIRNAFDRTATLADRAREFIAKRQQAVATRTTSSPVLAGPIVAVHAVPLAGLAERRSVDLQNVYHSTFSNFMGLDWGGASRSFNFDGLVIHPGGNKDDGYYAYTHIFRFGALEACSLSGEKRQIQQGQPERSIIWSLDLSRFVHSNATKFLSSLQAWDFGGPAFLSIALLNTKGYELGIGEVFHPFSRATADRDHLIPPPSWIESIGSTPVDAAVRPALDMLWQAFGLERCLDFDKSTGAFKPRPR